MHAVLGARFRHGHVEGSLLALPPCRRADELLARLRLSTQSDKRRFPAESALDHSQTTWGSQFCDLAPGPERQVFEPPWGAQTLHLLSSITFRS